MDLIFDTTGYINRRNFKPETAARLFRKVWDWAENFKRMIANDSYTKIKKVTIKKDGGDSFDERLSITVQVSAYGLDLEEKIIFCVNEILYPKKTKKTFDELMTQRLVESFERIQVTLSKQSSSINETLTGLTPK